MTTRFIVVRHCEAEGNIKRVFNGVSNGDITENGLKQLSYLSHRFENIKFDYIYSSPLLRAVKTARACNVFENKPIHILKSLIEINGGALEEMPFADFPKYFPSESEQWNIEPHKFNITGGESMESVYNRMAETVLMLEKRHKGSTVVLSSHGCAIRNLLCWASGTDFCMLNEIEWGENTCISVIDLNDGVPTVVAMNDAEHIPSNHQTLGKQTWWKKENRDNLVFE